MEKKELTKRLLLILGKRLNLSIKATDVYENDRHFLRGICNQLPPMDLGKEFYILQDELLLLEREEKGIVDISKFEYKDNIALWQGDITRLKADAIVNAANDQYLGCFVPCHNCIDNIIMSASGFQMRNELMMLKNQKEYDSEKVKVTKGYNLPCKFVFHVAGPEIFGKVSENDKKALQDCYINCLDKAKEMKLSNIVFCCISTGVYSFPNEEACEIAVATVKEWMQRNKIELKVVFNVFKDIDKVLYERELR